jgi:hypothetical protein
LCYKDYENLRMVESKVSHDTLLHKVHYVYPIPFLEKYSLSEEHCFFVLDIFHVLVLILIKKSRLCYTTKIKGENKLKEKIGLGIVLFLHFCMWVRYRRKFSFH